MRRRVLKPAVERAGVPWAGFHTFRHTCASLLFEGERNVKQVQAWLGHHDAASTLKTYVHLLDDGLGDAAIFDEAVQVGNNWATQASGTGRNRSKGEPRKIAV